MREKHLVKYCEDTRLGHQSRPLKNNTRFFVCTWRPRKSSFTRLFLVWGSLLIPHTLWITLTSSALLYKKPIRLPLTYMLILCSMQTNWQLLDALLKNPGALKVLVWSRGRLVTIQILTSSSFSLVEEIHGSSGECLSFSLIDVGSGFTAYVVFLFFSWSRNKKAAHINLGKGDTWEEKPLHQKKRAVSEDQERCEQTSQQTSPDYFEGEENAWMRCMFFFTVKTGLCALSERRTRSFFAPFLSVFFCGDPLYCACLA